MIERPDDRTPDTALSAVAYSTLSARQAADLLGVNERTIRRAIARGWLRASKHSGVFRIEREDLDRYRTAIFTARFVSEGLPHPLILLPKSPAQPPYHVPRPSTSLIGRTREVQAIGRLLTGDDVPLVTLVGPGGIGKTRLAIDVSAQVKDAFVDGVWFVDLSPLRDHRLVAATIGQGIGIREVAGRPAMDRLRDFLEQRRVLLLLDNFEQVVAAAPELATVLASCPGVMMLVTSRVPLRLSVERQYPVPPLPVPAPSEVHDLDQVGTVAAVQLFCQKMQSVRPDFVLTAGNASSVSAICTRLDGLPLAIELAAARGNVLSPQALLARLDHRLPLLTGGAGDVPPRLRSMRDAIAWSYDLLDEGGQRMFRRLAVFSGGFSECAASAVIRELLRDSGTTLDRLTSLVDNHLIIALDEGDDTTRFTMLETIREFGLEQLETCGEADETRDRHAAWLLDLVRQAEPYWFTADQKRLSDLMEREHDNLRAALDWLTTTGDRDAFVTLVGSIWPFWFVRSHWADGVSRLRRALDWTDGEHTIERIRVLTGAGCLWLMQRDEPRARAFNEEALLIAQQLDHVSPIDYPFNGLAICANSRGDFEEGIRWNEAALAAFQPLGNTVPRAMPLVSVILSNMAFVAYDRGETARAKTLAEEALVMQRDLGFTWAASDSLFVLARIAGDAGEADQATRMYRESLRLAAEHQDLQQIVDHVDRYAVIDRDAGRLDRAALMLGVGNRLHELLGVEPGAEQQASLDGVARAARSSLGGQGFTETWQAGRNLSLEESIAIALQIEVSAQPPGKPTAAARWGITPRELDVLCLVAEGDTDQEIADGLFISRRTVNTHVSHLLAKFDVPTRKQAVALARTEGLLPE